MNKTINIFILAAGLGERLKPITSYIPKPLLPILGKPALQYVLERISALPVNQIGVNLYHKKEVIEDWIRQYSINNTGMLGGNTGDIKKNLPSPPFDKGGTGGFLEKKIILFPEEEILGTGGALKNAGALLGQGTFLVHNSDIISDIDLHKFLEQHRLSGNLATLAVHDHPEFNSLVINEKGFLEGLDSPAGPENDESDITYSGRLAFTGIALYEPEFLKFLPAGASSVVDAWLQAISSGRKIGTLNVTGCYWSDIGTPSSYASAVFNALRSDGEAVYIHPSIKKCKNAELHGNIVIENNCIVDEGVSLRNCIMLPGCSLRKETINNPPFDKGGMVDLYENCILGNGFKVVFDESEVFQIRQGKQLIGTGGSDRTYHRFKESDRSFVLMQCRDDDPDFERQIEYTKFFLKYSVPVPDMIEADHNKKSAIFEDAGDISLYSRLKCPREEKDIENVYRKALDALIIMHTSATDHVSECGLLKNRIFDHEYFRWETGYFLERFAEGVRNIKVEDMPALEKELNRMASKADSFPKTIIHRDFQSQNIMVVKGKELRIIDYQGARMGPPAYDIASFLWDPYFRLEENMRERLLDYYIRRRTGEIIPPHPPLAKGGRGGFNVRSFGDSILICRLQRHMQALGAYGFLSMVKGKKYFLKHVPEGLRLLKEDISHAKNEYPRLYNLIAKL